MTHRAPRFILSLALVAVAAGVFAGGPASAADPIRIGFLAPMTGIFAQAGGQVAGDTEDGGLMSYGPDGLECFTRAPEYVDRILKVARAIGVTFRPELRSRADVVIE